MCSFSKSSSGFGKLTGVSVCKPDHSPGMFETLGRPIVRSELAIASRSTVVLSRYEGSDLPAPPRTERPIIWRPRPTHLITSLRGLAPTTILICCPETVTREPIAVGSDFPAFTWLMGAWCCEYRWDKHDCRSTSLFRRPQRNWSRSSQIPVRPQRRVSGRLWLLGLRPG